MAEQLEEKVESKSAIASNLTIRRILWVSILMRGKLHNFEVEDIGALLGLD